MFYADTYKGTEIYPPELHTVEGIQEITFKPERKTHFHGTERIGETKIGRITEHLRAAVTLLFSSPDRATYFRRNIIERNPTDFTRIKQRNEQLQFDLTTQLVGNMFDIVSQSPSGPIDWGLIEKYGGIHALMKYLWEKAEAEIIDTTAQVFDK